MVGSRQLSLSASFLRVARSRYATSRRPSTSLPTVSPTSVVGGSPRRWRSFLPRSTSSASVVRRGVGVNRGGQKTNHVPETCIFTGSLEAKDIALSRRKPGFENEDLPTTIS